MPFDILKDFGCCNCNCNFDELMNTENKGAGLSGTGDSQRDSRESIRANHSLLKPQGL